MLFTESKTISGFAAEQHDEGGVCGVPWCPPSSLQPQQHGRYIKNIKSRDSQPDKQTNFGVSEQAVASVTM